MELKDFCKGLEHELTGWKAKLFDMQRKIDTFRCVNAHGAKESRERFFPA